MLGFTMKKEKLKESKGNNQAFTPLLGTYHQTIETLPYNLFIKVNTTKSLQHLVIKGNVPNEKLIEAWENIAEEYSDTIKTDKSTNQFELGKKIMYNEWQLNIIEKSLWYLRQKYDGEIADVLAVLGYNVTSNIEDIDAYNKSLDAIETEAKFLIIKQNQYKIEYDSFNNGSNEGIKEKGDIDYEKELLIISKVMGYSIDASKITTLRYCAMLNLYIEDFELKKQAANG